MATAVIVGALFVVVGLALVATLKSRREPRSALDAEIEKLNAVLARAERYKPENEKFAIKL